jgi:hypothetical protein
MHSFWKICFYRKFVFIGKGEFSVKLKFTKFQIVLETIGLLLFPLRFGIFDQVRKNYSC